MLRIAKNPELRRHQVENSLEFVKKFTWDTNRAGYLDLVDFLVTGKPRISFPSGKPAHHPAQSSYSESQNGNGNSSRGSNGNGWRAEHQSDSKTAGGPRTKSGTLTL